MSESALHEAQSVCSNVLFYVLTFSWCA